ncbi:hypothetical protein BT96DRAFT_987978 [Gymnopus androsaceus JB14]|uniref:Uncharacterized protein n=1 Tax=Gymnopus androsaceus JB14 TaxID=1447944 RepID=A0A6A4I616_9AGAR|nr:hypothetical protein BT96DRAFT_987978 [Gymnopus androsaceus JB14]
MASLSTIELQLAYQIVGTLGKRPNAHHNGNLHFTGAEERVMLLQAFDSEEEGLEEYVASAVAQREAMRQLLRARISPLEDQFLQELRLGLPTTITPDVDLHLQNQAYRKAFYKVRKDYQKLLEERQREREAEKRRLRKNSPGKKQDVEELEERFEYGVESPSKALESVQSSLH